MYKSNGTVMESVSHTGDEVEITSRGVRVFLLSTFFPQTEFSRQKGKREERAKGGEKGVRE